MKKTILISMISAAGLLLGTAGCSDLSEIEERIDRLESRISAIEKIIPSLNENIIALKALAEGGTISSVEEQDGTYVITLSNGDVLTLNQGSIGVANPPVMSIDEDGYWMVDYGNGPEHILADGQKIRATGEDGITPLIGVDQEGYWTISYDAGKSYEQIKGAEGNPVSAQPKEGANEYFADVQYDGTSLVIVLKEGGESISIPVVSDFYFIIDVKGEQVLSAGKTYTYAISSKGVASASVIARPEGVEVTLDESTLTVKAPETTKAATADSSKDIAILAVSEKGAATIAKMQVRLGGEDVEETPPAALVSAGEKSTSSLSFSITLTDADSYRYILLEADAEAPTKGQIIEEGQAETSETLLLEELAPSTSYILYVLPASGSTYGEIVTTENSTENSTSDDADLYEMYNAGLPIDVGGIQITKDEYGEATLITSESEQKGIGKNGVYFVDSDVTATFNSGIGGLVVIGTSETVRSRISRSQVSYLSATEGEDYLIMKNISWTDCEAMPFQLNVENQFEKVILDNCLLNVADNADKPDNQSIIFSNSAKKTATDISIINCDIELGTNANIIKMGGSIINSINLKNNVIFSDTEMTSFQIVDLAKATVESITLTNNTLYNTTIDNALVSIQKSLTDMQAKNNYFVYCNSSAGNSFIASCTTLAGGSIDNNFYVRKDGTSTPIYGVPGTKPDWVVQPALKNAPEKLTSEWNPDGGIYRLGGYQGVGAKR